MDIVLVAILIISASSSPLSSAPGAREPSLPHHGSNDRNTHDDDRDDVPRNDAAGSTGPGEPDPSVHNAQHDDRLPEVAVDRAVPRRPPRQLEDAMVPEPQRPLQDQGRRADEPDDLVRRAERLRPGVHGAEVDAHHDAEEGQRRGEGLVRPVPAHALRDDAQEDDARRHEEDEGGAGREGVDDGGPVAVARGRAVLRGADRLRE